MSLAVYPLCPSSDQLTTPATTKSKVDATAKKAKAPASNAGVTNLGPKAGE
jgi:hypothetical protein